MCVCVLQCVPMFREKGLCVHLGGVGGGGGAVEQEKKKRGHVEFTAVFHHALCVLHGL